jgi:hypothetical protein
MGNCGLFTYQQRQRRVGCLVPALSIPPASTFAMDLYPFDKLGSPRIAADRRVLSGLVGPEQPAIVDGDAGQAGVKHRRG